MDYAENLGANFAVIIRAVVTSHIPPDYTCVLVAELYKINNVSLKRL